VGLKKQIHAPDSTLWS